MADHFVITFQSLTREQKEIVIAVLSEKDYNGFEEEDDLLKAFIPETFFDQRQLRHFASRLGLSFTIVRIPAGNWNKDWESNFRPVIINHPQNHVPWVGVRAAFHEPLKGVEHEIIITPKMSFGTGH